MKLTIYITLIAIYTDICYAKADNDNVFYMYGTELKHDKPLNIDFFVTNLLFSSATGSIGYGTFSRVNQLLTLKIVGSSIDYVEDGSLCWPGQLQELVLYNITLFPALTASLLGNCKSVTHLELRGSGLQIHQDAFRNMTSLEYLKIGDLSGTFNMSPVLLRPLINLRSLELVGFEIQEIVGHSICYSPNLKSLYLHDVKIREYLAGYSFVGCKMVKYFTFTKNHAVTDQNAFGGLTSATKVSLSNLSIMNLTKVFLSPFSNADYLRIEESNITKINSDAFENCTSLKILIISSSNLREIESGAFANLPKLEELYLERNQLTTIDNIRNDKLNYINAGFNWISRVDWRLVKSNLPKLNFLTLTYNPINCDYADRLKNILTNLYTSCDGDGEVDPKSMDFIL